MAQNFKQIKLAAIGTAVADIPDGSNFPTGFHFIKSINMANITDNTIEVSVFVVATADDAPSDNTKFHIVKNMALPRGSAFAYDAGINILAGDRLFFESDTASSLDVIVSYVQEIST